MSEGNVAKHRYTKALALAVVDASRAAEDAAGGQHLCCSNAR
jgi:hypothetical protein